jgi:hypothetical protein
MVSAVKNIQQKRLSGADQTGRMMKGTNNLAVPGFGNTKSKKVICQGPHQEKKLEGCPGY